MNARADGMRTSDASADVTTDMRHFIILLPADMEHVRINYVLSEAGRMKADPEVLCAATINVFEANI